MFTLPVAVSRPDRPVMPRRPRFRPGRFAASCPVCQRSEPSTSPSETFRSAAFRLALPLARHSPRRTDSCARGSARVPSAVTVTAPSGRVRLAVPSRAHSPRAPGRASSTPLPCACGPSTRRSCTPRALATTRAPAPSRPASPCASGVPSGPLRRSVSGCVRIPAGPPVTRALPRQPPRRSAVTSSAARRPCGPLRFPRAPSACARFVSCTRPARVPEASTVRSAVPSRAALPDASS